MHFENMTKLVDNDLSRKYRFQTKHSTKYAAGKLAQTARAVDRSTERWNWYQKQTRKFCFFSECIHSVETISRARHKHCF